MHSLKEVFSAGPFLPHGFCYLWNSGLVWLHLVSDVLIGLAYTSIPITLVYIMRKRRDVPFNWMFLCFGMFIVSCGATHFMEVVTLWIPAYWASGGVKAITAMASVPTAILLVRLVPQVLVLPRPQELRLANEALQMEIRERQEAENVVRQLNEDLLRHADELVQMNKDLESFTYSVSHDLRAPLRHINGYTAMLRDALGTGLKDPAEHHLRAISEAAVKMDGLVNDLLIIARVGQQELKLQVTGLNTLLDEALLELQEETRGREIAWKIGPLPFVVCDPGLMKQVFVNLLSNSIKYTRPRKGAAIEIAQDPNDERAPIFVRDNGVGFDMLQAGRLFGVFQRLHRAEDFEGTGAGLAIVKRILQKHGGTIWAEAALDKGATFFFTVGPSQSRGPAGERVAQEISRPD